MAFLLLTVLAISSMRYRAIGPPSVSLPAHDLLRRLFLGPIKQRREVRLDLENHPVSENAKVLRPEYSGVIHHICLDVPNQGLMMQKFA